MEVYSPQPQQVQPKTWVTLPPRVTEESSNSRSSPNILVSWPESDSSNIGIRPYSSFTESTSVNYNNKVNSTYFTSNGKSSKDSSHPNFIKVIGSFCKHNSECNTRVPRSHCSFGNICECLYSFHYDENTDSCFKVKSYNERCSSSFNDGCHNSQLRCSEFGLCTCHHGFHYESGKNPYCQPNNSSSCDPGQTWDPLRARCVRPRIHTLFTDSTPHFPSGGYDRNRYSLFFSVILILVLMVILFKSKKSHPFPWDRRPRRMSRSISYAEALGFAFGVRSNPPPSHPGHIIPPPHQGPFDVPSEFYGWNHHHHHHHHPHLQSLVVTMPHGRTGTGSLDTVNSGCHLIPEVMTVGDGINCPNSVPGSPSRLGGTMDSSSSHSTCIPPPPYASTLSLATAAAACSSSDSENIAQGNGEGGECHGGTVSTEKPPTYEEAIRFDATLLPMTNTDLNNNNTGPVNGNHHPSPCVAGNCSCSHLTCSHNPQGFICLTTSPSVARCHSVTSGTNHSINLNEGTGSSSGEMADGTMVHKAYVPSSSESSIPSSSTMHGSTVPRAVVVSTTQHCSGTHVPYLTPPVHSLPYSARLRDYPYPVSPWPVAHGSRSERYRLHRSTRPMNYTRSHFSRTSSTSSNSGSNSNGSGNSFISFLRRGTSFMAGVTSRHRDHRQNNQQSSSSSSSSCHQGTGRNSASPVDHIRPQISEGNELEDSLATESDTTQPNENERQAEPSRRANDLIADTARNVTVIGDGEEDNISNNRNGELNGSFGMKKKSQTLVKRENDDEPSTSQVRTESRSQRVNDLKDQQFGISRMYRAKASVKNDFSHDENCSQVANRTVTDDEKMQNQESTLKEEDTE